MDREVYFFEDRSCDVVCWSSDVRGKSLLEHWEALLQDPRFRPSFAALHDARGRSLDVDWSDARLKAHTYRAEVEPQVGFGRLAILVDREQVRSG